MSDANGEKGNEHKSRYHEARDLEDSDSVHHAKRVFQIGDRFKCNLKLRAVYLLSWIEAIIEPAGRLNLILLYIKRFFRVT